MGESLKQSVSKIAGADLSTKQFYGVKLNSSGQIVLADAAGEPILGVLDNKPTSGKVGTVAVAGIVQCIAGGVIAAGGPVKVNASGKFVAATAGNTTVDGNAQSNVALLGSNVIGRSMMDAATADGDIFDMLITREGAVPATAS